MSIKEKYSAAEQPSEDEQWVFDLAAKHEARTGTLFGPVTFSSTSLLDFVRDVAAHLARQSPAPGRSIINLKLDLMQDLMRFECVLTPDGKAEMYASETGAYVWFDHVVSTLAAPVAQEVEPGSAPAAADEVRNQALEEAAELAERCYLNRPTFFELGVVAAREIRALKSAAIKAADQQGALGEKGGDGA